MIFAYHQSVHIFFSALSAEKKIYFSSANFAALVPLKAGRAVKNMLSLTRIAKLGPSAKLMVYGINKNPGRNRGSPSVPLLKILSPYSNIHGCNLSNVTNTPESKSSMNQCVDFIISDSKLKHNILYHSANIIPYLES